MSKITINAVITVLRLALSLVGKVIRLLYSVSDLVDDGCLNASVPLPDWIFTLRSALCSMEALSSHIGLVTEQAEKEL